MRNTRFKFSLRLLLVLVLFASLVFWRYSVRLEMASWASEIQDRGGRVLYAWQDPRLVMEEISGQGAPRPVLRDGKIEYEYVFGRPFQVQRLYFARIEKPPVKWADVLTGRNGDLQVVCVAIAADQLDEKTITILQQMPKLKTVVFPSSVAPVETAKRLDQLKERLPNVELSSPVGVKLNDWPVH